MVQNQPTFHLSFSSKVSSMNKVKHNSSCNSTCRYQGKTFTAPSQTYIIDPTLAIEWASASDVIDGINNGDLKVLDSSDNELSSAAGLAQLRNPAYWF